MASVFSFIDYYLLVIRFVAKVSTANCFDFSLKRRFQTVAISFPENAASFEINYLCNRFQ